MNNLTKIASLPGSGAGCMASLPAEKNEQPSAIEPVDKWVCLWEREGIMNLVSGRFVHAKEMEANRKPWEPVMDALRPQFDAYVSRQESVKVQMKSPYFDDLDWPSIVFLDEEPDA